MKLTNQKATKRKPTMQTTKKPMAQETLGDETFYRALGELMRDSAKGLMPFVEEGDEVDSLRLCADVCSVAAFVAEREKALHAGQPEPAFPSLTSKVARNFAAGLHTWLTEFVAHLAACLPPGEKINVALIQQLLERSFKGRDGEFLQFMRQIISSDPRKTAYSVTCLSEIAKWQAL